MNVQVEGNVQGDVNMPQVQMAMPAVQMGMPAVQMGVPAVQMGMEQQQVQMGMPQVQMGVQMPQVGFQQPQMQVGFQQPQFQQGQMPMPGMTFQMANPMDPAMFQIQHEIIGSQLQGVRMVLMPGQQLIAEAGAMLFIDDGIMFESRLGDGSLPTAADANQGFFGGMMAAVKNMATRLISNESLFRTWYSNPGPQPRAMALAAPMMGTMLSLNLHQLPNAVIHAEGGAFVASTIGVIFEIEVVKKFGAGLFGGEGFILQKLTAQPGTAGQLWLHGAGTIIRKELNNEELTLDPGCLMAFTDGISYDIGFPGFANAMMSGNVFMTKVSGTGSVWIQSTPGSRMIDAIIAMIPQEAKNDS